MPEMDREKLKQTLLLGLVRIYRMAQLSEQETLANLKRQQVEEGLAGRFVRKVYAEPATEVAALDSAFTRVIPIDSLEKALDEESLTKGLLAKTILDIGSLEIT